MKKGFTPTPMKDRKHFEAVVDYFVCGKKDWKRHAKKREVSSLRNSSLVSGFTLLELLITVGILAILATTAVLIVSPVEYLRQSRDTRRIGDLKTIDDAISTAIANSPNITQGTAQTVYISIPDTATNCPSMTATLPTLPTGWGYYCASSADYKKTNGTGWLPINFDSLPVKSPLATLPGDPTNDASKGLYYEYISGGSYALSASLESEKYLKQSAAKDNGYDPARIETGSDMKLLAKADGLVGYWPLDEGSGAVANDMSGNGLNGIWFGSGARYVAGKVGIYTGQFNGSDDYVAVSSSSIGQNALTVSAWVKSQDPGVGSQYIGIANKSGSFLLRSREDTVNMLEFFVYLGGNPEPRAGVTVPSFNTWHYVVATYDSVGGANNVKLYVNGVVQSTQTRVGLIDTNVNALAFGREGSYLPGSIDDLRIYNRALSSAEIQTMYNATK